MNVEHYAGAAGVTIYHSFLTIIMSGGRGHRRDPAYEVGAPRLRAPQSRRSRREA